jgi:hypothetical protein
MLRTIPLFILALTLLFGSAAAVASTYYLSPSGNDSNNGMFTAYPWLTPNHKPGEVAAHDRIGAIRKVIEAELVELQFAKRDLKIVSFPEQLSHDTHPAFGVARCRRSLKKLKIRAHLNRS